jgi:hypothetical protein
MSANFRKGSHNLVCKDLSWLGALHSHRLARVQMSNFRASTQACNGAAIADLLSLALGLSAQC